MNPNNPVVEETAPGGAPTQGRSWRSVRIAVGAILAGVVAFTGLVWVPTTAVATNGDVEIEGGYYDDPNAEHLADLTETDKELLDYDFEFSDTKEYSTFEEPRSEAKEKAERQNPGYDCVYVDGESVWNTDPPFFHWQSNFECTASLTEQGSVASSYCHAVGIGDGLGQCRLKTFVEERRIAYVENYSKPVSDLIYNCSLNDMKGDVGISVWRYSLTTESETRAVGSGYFGTVGAVGSGATVTVTKTTGATTAWSSGTYSTQSITHGITVPPGHVGWVEKGSYFGLARGIAEVEIPYVSEQLVEGTGITLPNVDTFTSRRIVATLGGDLWEPDRVLDKDAWDAQNSGLGKIGESYRTPTFEMTDEERKLCASSGSTEDRVGYDYGTAVALGKDPQPKPLFMVGSSGSPYQGAFLDPRYEKYKHLLEEREINASASAYCEIYGFGDEPGQCVIESFEEIERNQELTNSYREIEGTRQEACTGPSTVRIAGSEGTVVGSTEGKFKDFSIAVQKKAGFDYKGISIGFGETNHLSTRTATEVSDQTYNLKSNGVQGTTSPGHFGWIERVGNIGVSTGIAQVRVPNPVGPGSHILEGKTFNVLTQLGGEGLFANLDEVDDSSWISRRASNGMLIGNAYVFQSPVMSIDEQRALCGGIVAEPVIGAPLDSISMRMNDDELEFTTCQAYFGSDMDIQILAQGANPWYEWKDLQYGKETYALSPGQKFLRGGIEGYQRLSWDKKIDPGDTVKIQLSLGELRDPLSVEFEIPSWYIPDADADDYAGQWLQPDGHWSKTACSEEPNEGPLYSEASGKVAIQGDFSEGVDNLNFVVCQTTHGNVLKIQRMKKGDYSPERWTTSLRGEGDYTLTAGKIYSTSSHWDAAEEYADGLPGRIVNFLSNGPGGLFELRFSTDDRGFDDLNAVFPIPAWGIPDRISTESFEVPDGYWLQTDGTWSKTPCEPQPLTKYGEPNNTIALQSHDGDLLIATCEARAGNVREFSLSRLDEPGNRLYFQDDFGSYSYEAGEVISFLGFEDEPYGFFKGAQMGFEPGDEIEVRFSANISFEGSSTGLMYEKFWVQKWGVPDTRDDAWMQTNGQWSKTPCGKSTEPPSTPSDPEYGPSQDTIAVQSNGDELQIAVCSAYMGTNIVMKREVAGSGDGYDVFWQGRGRYVLQPGQVLSTADQRVENPDLPGVVAASEKFGKDTFSPGDNLTVRFVWNGVNPPQQFDSALSKLFKIPAGGMPDVSDKKWLQPNGKWSDEACDPEKGLSAGDHMTGEAGTTLATRVNGGELEVATCNAYSGSRILMQLMKKDDALGNGEWDRFWSDSGKYALTAGQILSTADQRSSNPELPGTVTGSREFEPGDELQVQLLRNGVAGADETFYLPPWGMPDAKSGHWLQTDGTWSENACANVDVDEGTGQGNDPGDEPVPPRTTSAPGSSLAVQTKAGELQITNCSAFFGSEIKMRLQKKRNQGTKKWNTFWVSKNDSYALGVGQLLSTGEQKAGGSIVPGKVTGPPKFESGDTLHIRFAWNGGQSKVLKTDIPARGVPDAEDGYWMQPNGDWSKAPCDWVASSATQFEFGDPGGALAVQMDGDELRIAVCNAYSGNQIGVQAMRKGPYGPDEWTSIWSGAGKYSISAEDVLSTADQRDGNSDLPGKVSAPKLTFAPGDELRVNFGAVGRKGDERLKERFPIPSLGIPDKSDGFWLQPNGTWSTKACA